MNTSGPDDKRRLAGRAAARGIPFVDAAIMAPVPRARIDTPLLLSGPGVARLLPVLAELRVPATDVGPEPGAAARLKLLRSIFMKGLAAVVVESMNAAELFGARGLADRSDRVGARRVGPGRRAAPASTARPSTRCGARSRCSRCVRCCSRSTRRIR